MTYDPNTPSQPSYPAPPAAPQQGYGNAPAYGAGGGYPDARPQAGNGMAIAGFVLSLVGILLFGIVLGPLGVIFSIIGLNRANKGAKFKGLAIAGIIIGAIVTILSIIGLIALSSSGFMNY